MREIIDIDQLSDWCVAVRVRGRLIETRNPLRCDMTLLDKRLKRADYATEADLSAARKSLLDQMLDRIFIGDAWNDLKRAAESGDVDALAPFEKLSIVFHYTLAHASAVHGQEHAAALAARGFTLIEEDEAKTQAPASAAPRRAPDLPEGLHVGAAGEIRPVSPGEAGG